MTIQFFTRYIITILSYLMYFVHIAKDYMYLTKLYKYQNNVIK